MTCRAVKCKGARRRRVNGRAVQATFGDVLDVVRAAVDLGAEGRGGPLSPRERRLVAQVRRRTPLRREAKDALAAEIEAGGDPLGEALQRLRSREELREIGSFYTPREIVVAMVRWAVSSKTTILVDPGCGSGRFACEAVRQGSRARIVAIDDDEYATLVARANLEVLKPRRAIVVNRDFLKLKTIPGGRGRHAQVAFCGNPPYVRHHYLTLRAKERGAKLAIEAGHPSYLNAGLHTLFFAKTKLLAGRHDVGCYVTSAEWLDNTTGKVVRELFLNGLGGTHVMVVDPTTFAFAGVKTTAAITRFVIGGPSDSRRLAVNVPLDRIGAYLDGDADHVSISKSKLENARGWTDLATNPDRVEHDGPTIGDLFRVNRGTATGTNAYFALKRERARELGIERHCVPTVTSADEIIAANGVLRDSPALKVVLDLPPTFDRKADRVVDAYLRSGETAPEGETPPSRGFNASQRRKVWYSVALSRPLIVATYMARRPPAFAANPDRLGILNIALGLTPKRPLSDEQIALVVDVLNAAGTDLERYAVRYFGNLRKYEPRAVAALPLPEGLRHLVEAAEATAKP
jgi:adenine-specific DNA-methyltransferase